ncbi:hypothetical protein E2C01_006608 [Portunus trituberculatus]|uniref:Uncharacterized protein n=1 Tax=Portunus trituberculatus TaxID=210409 RepID=A0A5B7CWQ8_PORTR|nr:hypothetical protein [Portunus trituberculatus]
MYIHSCLRGTSLSQPWKAVRVSGQPSRPFLSLFCSPLSLLSPDSAATSIHRPSHLTPYIRLPSLSILPVLPLPRQSFLFRSLEPLPPHLLSLLLHVFFFSLSRKLLCSSLGDTNTPPLEDLR